MQDIINKLYELHLNTEALPLGTPNKENLNEEWRLYNFLYENLSAECKEKFFEYTNLRTDRQNEEAKNAYMYGFKTAIKLIIESLSE